MFISTRPRVGRCVAALAVAAAVAIGVGACVPPPVSPVDGVAPTTAPPLPTYRVLGGVEQIYVIGATPGSTVTIRRAGASAGAAVVGSGVADRLGSWVLRDLEQGATYTVVNEGRSTDVTVLRAEDHPDDGFYRATRMVEGMNYVPMRDGITLNATVRPPIGFGINDGPFPTVIEYSGYQTAAPHEPLTAKILGLLGLPADPLAPGSETDVGSLLMRLAGFAVVSVQLRGSGCSGGEADLFDLPSRLDGYDIVETVARQPWVQGGRVGMVGISFSGFSQIATAATHPPHLAAVAPLSFVGSLYDLAHPGGIFNDGFAKSWMADRVKSARPAPHPDAMPYANELVRTDPVCRDNQALRLQTRDGDAMIRSEEFDVGVYPRRDFREWMADIEVPTFASLQFEDEETSSYAILSSQDLLDANDRVWLHLSSGHHRDAVTPETITQLMEFLDIYVAQRPPQPKLLIHLLSDVIFGTGSVAPPLTTILTDSLDDAQRRFEARPRVQVLLELAEGANEGRNSGTRWKFATTEFPVPGSTERTWFLDDAGRLGDAPGAPATASYRPDPALRRDQILPVISTPGMSVPWSPVTSGTGIGFVSEPLTEDVVALGPAAATIQLSSTAADTDLGLTVTEVRPDGQEMLVSTGVQRASKRATGADSTPTRPDLLFDRIQPLEPGAVVEVPVQVLPIGHVFRAGSRIRLGIAAVGGDREKWSYDAIDPDGGSTTNTVHLGGAVPSSLTMTLAPVRGYPAELQPCPSSGKPCRPYAPAVNGG